MDTANANRPQVEFPAHDRPSTDINTLQLLGMGVLLCVAVFGVAYVVGGFFKDLLIGNPVPKPERIFFQSMIVFVWSCSIANIILKIIKINRERAHLDENLVPPGTDFSDSAKLTEIYDHLKSRPNLNESLGLTRIARVLAMWINTGDFQRTAEYARNQAEMDALASDATFRRNRLFIWAMPLLGFVGTVFGVAAGISHFEAFLKQANVTPEEIKIQVGAITSGLAVAFYCTLLGLVSAGAAAFPSLMAERKEEAALNEIDELVEDRLISHMPSAGTEANRFPVEELVTAIRTGMEGMQTQSRFPVEDLAQAIDAGFRRLPNPERYEEVFTRAIGKAADLISEKFGEFQTNYERRVSELGSQLGGKLEVVSNNFNTGNQRFLGDFSKAQERTLEQFAKNDQKLTERFDELSEGLTRIGKELVEQLGDSHEQYIDAVSELDKKEIQRWEKMVNDFNQLSQRLADQFRQAVSGMDSASQRYAEQIRTSVEALVGQLENVGKLGAEIDKVLRTTQSMETALRQVGNSDEFRQTLANLRSHLVTSDELLKQLSRPRKVVFQEARSEE